MPRLAYRDEYPWIRCSCGYIIGHDTVECPGCGEILEYENIEFLDRFAPTYPTHYYLPDGEFHRAIVHPIDVEGREYKPVKYEDRYRRG